MVHRRKGLTRTWEKRRITMFTNWISPWSPLCWTSKASTFVGGL